MSRKLSRKIHTTQSPIVRRSAIALYIMLLHSIAGAQAVTNPAPDITLVKEDDQWEPPTVSRFRDSQTVIANPAAVQFMWSGAITPTTARVNAKLTTDNTVARLVVSERTDFSWPRYSQPGTALTSENNRVVSFHVSGLNPNRKYFYAVEIAGILDLGSIGTFRTFPVGNASFTFAFASCAYTGSSHAAFETIHSLQPLFFFHLGDFHYENIAVNDRNRFRLAFETVLASSTQSLLYRAVPIAYVWDDHDYGPNNSDSTATGRIASRLTYQEYVPHYPLAAGSGNVAIYCAFSVGRVRFIVCDSRSARSPASAVDNAPKTMLGTTQKVWFKQELLEASKTHALIVWVNTLPWIGLSGDDGWHLYTAERAELANFIRDNQIDNLCMISGDAHMLAIDDGTNSDFATGGGAAFPVMHAAALHRTPGVKGGPYSHGAYPGSGQFGLMSVVDTGDSISVRWSGRNYLNQEIVGYEFTFAANLPKAVISPNPMHLYLSQSIEPVMGSVVFGDFTDGHQASEIRPESIRLNGTIGALSSSLMHDHPVFSTEAMEATFPVDEFMTGYMPLYDTTVHEYTVSGQFNDGSPFVVRGDVAFIGRRSGDLDFDGRITIADLTLIVEFFFGDGPVPADMRLADFNQDGTVSLADMAALAIWLFL
ncbi:MAG TPA: alkaline phosphatase D family protein [Candidatus Deferrimicrobium sp.]|nr:alkaline phosphatase D family protein [Candidatus Deferrimicrobium sp.]